MDFVSCYSRRLHAVPHNAELTRATPPLKARSLMNARELLAASSMLQPRAAPPPLPPGG